MTFKWLKSALLAFLLATSAWADEEFLDPAEAFRFSARLVSAEQMEVQYLIAEGYYMYRGRYRFDVEPDSIVLGTPQFPPGQWHEDEFFGTSEIYRGEVTIRIPILSGTGNSQTIRIVAVSQGCADAGICYIPTRQTADFEVLGSLGGPDRSR